TDVALDENTGKERSAQVEMSFIGAMLVYTVHQDGTPSGLKGDVNGDGVVDIADVNAAIDMILGLQTATAVADVNDDGTVDVADMNAIINIILGI
ncbi:MAG: dockerin type I repeat-containing protein, partial [Bacteroidales bacterium]|nr:dockerin type I repeat-containing protein [Candidatus Sodaliphilus fimicaballi]